MEDLPPELFDLIADQCAHSSLKNLRLVNHGYCEAVTPRVFEHFYMGIFDECHDKLISISKSNLAKYVKGMTVYLDLLPNWKLEAWEHAIDYKDEINYWKAHRLGQHVSTMQQKWNASDELPFDLDAPIFDFHGEPHHHLSQQQLDHGWKEYQRLRKQQLQWHESRHGMVLKECFSMLPNLDTVVCTPSYTTELNPFRRIWPVWRRIRHSIFVCPRDWPSFYPRNDFVERAIYDFSRRVSLLVLEAIAFRASFSGTKQITQLRLYTRQNGPWERMISRRSEYFSPAPDLAQFKRRSTSICDGLWSLTHIDWRISISPRDESECYSLAEETLLFLWKTNNLQNFTLSFSDHGCGAPQPDITSPGSATIDKILARKPSWPCLRRVRLSFRTSHAKLLSFFRFLSPSLRSLELMDMEVGDAGQLVSQIPEILKLDAVLLSKIRHIGQIPGVHLLFPETTDRDGPFERAVQDYLLRKSKQCPDLGLDVKVQTNALNLSD